MLFKPDFKTQIIEENEYPEKMQYVEQQLSQYAVSGEFESFDGCSISYEYYLAENSRASIIIVHGFTEFFRKYRELCWYFLHMGFNVFMYDQRGHGLSGRVTAGMHLAHVDNFYDYVRDLEEFTDRVIIPNSGKTPIYLYGHSMGGAVAALYLARAGKKIERAVLSAPMICPNTHGMPRKILKSMVSAAAKKAGWTAKFRYAGEFTAEVEFSKTSDMSRNRFEYNLKLRTDHIHYQNSSSTNRWIHEALSVQDVLLKASTTNSITAKVLVVSAQKDTVVKNAPQKLFAKLLPNGRFVQMQGAKHSMYNSPQPMLGEYVGLLMNFFSES